MESKITVAVIAAVISLLVAIISLIGTLISSKTTARTARGLEFLKHELLRSSKTIEFADSELNSSLSALKEALRAIQKIKNEIQLIINAINSSLDSDEALTKITTAREHLFATYESGHPNLNDIEIDAYHTAKDTALTIENVIRSQLKNKKYASNLSQNVRKNLIELRRQLTDTQQLLRDSKTDRLVQRTILR